MRFIAIACVLLAGSEVLGQPKRQPIQIGIQYAYPGGGKTFSQLSIPVAKFYPDSVNWGDMQLGPGLPIDFSKMDRFVLEYQAAGFSDLVLVLRSKSRWASINYVLNPAPKPQFLNDYEAWVRAIVERYSATSKFLPGLKRPVRFYEIGSEFSRHEPEPVEDYLAMFERAHRAAHNAYDRAVVLNAAFLAPMVFHDHPKPAQYAAEFDRINKQILSHSLDDIRRVLNETTYYNMVNFHAMSDPNEIEPTVAWLRAEMKERMIDKPIVISEATPDPLIAWGPATKLPPEAFGLPSRPGSVGLAVWPATDGDRPALIDYFNRLIDGDGGAINWTHAYAAADMVKKVVIAADQGVEMICLGFMEDQPTLKTRAAQASAGVSAWSGMADTDVNPLTEQRTIKSLRPSFYAIQQVQKYLRNYDSIERVKNNNSRVRIYKITRGETVNWIAWHDTPRLYLPGTKLPSTKFAFEVQGKSISVEKMIEKHGQTKPETLTVSVKNGVAEITLTPRPVFIRAN